MSRPGTFTLACAFVACALAMEALVHVDQLSAQVTGTPFASSIGTPFRAPDAPRSGLSTPYETSSEDWHRPTDDGDVELLARKLAARGFTEVSDVRVRGGAIICEATGPRRERVRLVLDAASGEIAGLKVIGFDGKPY